MRRKFQAFLSLAALATGAAAVLAPAQAQEAPPTAPPTAMIIVDGSGSMWGNLGTEKRPKLEMVRDAMRALLPSLRPDARVGLASFGHRRRGNCGDAEVIVPPSPVSEDHLSPSVDRMNAVGKGPLVLALREAANAIAGATPASVVLIADDIDNCGQNVCTALGDILRSNPRLVVHTIALGFDKPKIDHISCIPRLTGGKLWNAEDAAGLSSALAQAVSIARLQTGSEATPAASAETEAPARHEQPAGAPRGLYLSAALGAKSAPLDTPVHWRIAKSGDSEEIISEKRAAALYEKLEPGRYDVEARLGLAHARQTVELPPDTPVDVRVDLNGGVLKMLARPDTGGSALPATVFAVAPASNEGATTPLWIGHEAEPEIVLPAGEYVVSAQNGAARQQNTVKITAATGTTSNAVLAAGTLELSATRGTATSPGEALTEGVTFILYQDDPFAPQGRREVVRSAAPSPSFVLPAGTYYITARTQTSEIREQIAIGAGDTVRRALPLSLATVRLASTLMAQPAANEKQVTYRIVRLGTEAHEVTRTIEKDPQFELSAGRYRIEVSLRGTNVIAATELNLTAGQALKITLPLSAGSATFRRPVSSTAANDVFWEVRDEKQRVVMRSSQAEPTALLSPGRYLVSAETSDQPLRNTIEIKANEQRTFDISAPSALQP